MKDKSLFWRRHVDRQHSSSLSIQAYCDHHRLSQGMFYYWKRKLAISLGPEQFSEVEIFDHGANVQTIHVRFPTGVEMWLEGSVQASFLRTLAGC
jgi:hypothetical protein